MIIKDLYNDNKKYEIRFVGDHYVIQQFVKEFPCSKRQRMNLPQIASIFDMNKNDMRDLIRNS